MNKYKQIFLGQDGNKLLSGIPDNFSEYFDWTILPLNPLLPLIIRKKTNNPKTIYLKTDHLKKFIEDVLDNIPNEFILVTGASDFSPQVSWGQFHFDEYYKILINHPKLIFWFMNNLRFKNEKIFSLPCGFGAGKAWEGCTPVQLDDFILDIRNKSDKNNKIEKKIFCCFRDTRHQVCGEDMLIRPNIQKIVEKNKDLFDIYEPDQMNFKEFVKKLSNYKYALCPHGNGMDPSPTMWIALAVGTTPVIWKTPNVLDMFEGTDSVIYFDEFEEITDKNLYIEKSPMDFEFLTCEYWGNKINSKI